MRPLDAGYGLNMCADHCKCPKEYDPVCGQDMTFFSPCHAGCTNKELIDGSYFVSEIVRLSVCLSVCPCFHVYGCLTFGLSACLSVFLSVYLSVCLSVRLSVCPFVCLCVCLVSVFACLSVCLY